MTNYVLSIDCGVSTGIALLSYAEETPATLVKAWQFPGGVMGLLNWFRGDEWERISFMDLGLGPLTVIAEKFTARNTKGFAYTTASLEPLRGEGALIALGLMPDYDAKEKRWRDPNGQYIFGGTEKVSKKKAQAAWLKANGFYVTGKTLGTPDADDARSAMGHGIGYTVKELKHKPTWDLLRGANE